MTDSTAAPPPNRRRHPRGPLPGGSVIFIAAGELATLSVREISAGGIFVYARQAPRVGAQVQIEFELGGGGYFSVPGIVVRDETSAPTGDRPGFAVRFEQGERERERLAMLLSQAR